MLEFEICQIPKSVISIGNQAFSGCYSLKSNILPNSVKAIKHEAFSTCSPSLINIPWLVVSFMEILSPSVNIWKRLMSLRIWTSFISMECCLTKKWRKSSSAPLKERWLLDSEHSNTICEGASMDATNWHQSRFPARLPRFVTRHVPPAEDWLRYNTRLD